MRKLFSILLLAIISSCTNNNKFADTSSNDSTITASGSTPVPSITNYDYKQFKNVKENSTVAFEDLKVKVSTVALSNQWTFDSYSDEWHYRSAERGDKFIVVKLSITADNKDPLLPAVSLYKIENGKMFWMSDLEYKFVRWQDFATYLGNYADYKNDFAHTATIPFTLADSFSEKLLNDATIIVVVHHKGCYQRQYDRFGNPPVSYVQKDFTAPNALDPAEAGKSYSVIKIFNKQKL